MGNNKLHIVAVKSGSQKFDKKDFVLTLPRAEEFTVTIKEYLADLKAVREGDVADLNKAIENQTKSLATEGEKLGANGWTDKERELYLANIKSYNKTKDVIEKGIGSIEKSIAKKYDKVVWKWQLYKDLSKKIGSSSTISMGHGLRDGVRKRKFPKSLEGGGFVWIEPFFDGDTPKGRPPHGCYVRAIGTPKIKKVKWTSDAKGDKSIIKAKLKQTVFLHIETEGLYGQDIEIYLFDKDFTLNPDDELRAPDGTRKFQREVSVYPKGSKSDGITSNSHIQKAIFKLIIDASWEQTENIDIYSKIVYKENRYTKNVRSVEKVFDGIQLEIEGRKDVENVESNIAIVKGKIETNAAEFHPCRYEKVTVDFEEDDKTKTLILFDSEDKTVKDKLLYPIVAGTDQKRKKFTIKVAGVDTKECFYKETSDYHKNHVIDITAIEDRIEEGHGGKSEQWRGGKTSDYLEGGEVKTEKSNDQNDDRKIDASHFKNQIRLVNGISEIKAQKSFEILEKNRPFKFQQPTDEKLELEVGYDYSFGGHMHPLLGLFNTINPTAERIKQKYPIKIQSCARIKPLEIAVIPDTKWTVQLGFNYNQEKFNIVREAYHQKWQSRKIEDEKVLKRLERKRDDSQGEFMEKYMEVEKLKKEAINITNKKDKKKINKKIEKKERKLDKIWNKKVSSKNEVVWEAKKKLKKAKSKTSAKGKLSKAIDLMEPDDALEHGLIDCSLSMIAEFDRPYGALELSSKMDEITDFIKKIADIKEKVDNIINGKDNRAKKSNPKNIKNRLKNIKGKLKPSASKWSFEFIPPSIGLSVSWHAERPKDINKPIMGTMWQGVIDMNPLFGFEVKYDAYHLLYKIKHPVVLVVVATLDLLDNVLGNNFNINLDLTVTSLLSGTLMGTVNTAEHSSSSNRLKEDEDDTPAKFGGSLDINFKGEINGMGTVDPLFFKKKTIYGAVSVSASSGISMEFVTKADAKSIFLEPEIKFEGLLLKAGASAGVVNQDDRFDEDKKSIDELKKETGLHYTADGEVIVFDAYVWEKTNWRIPIYTL